MTNRITAALGAMLLLWMVAASSPSGVGWAAFAADPSPFNRKAEFFVDMYLVPAALAFLAVMAFQTVQRISMTGAPVGTVFGTAVVAWSLMLYALSGLGSVSRPAVIGGMALGLAISAQVYAVSLPKCRFGFRYPHVIFRWNKRAVEEFAAVRVSGLATRTPGGNAP